VGTQNRTRRSRGSPSFAALLSFVWPGLGQLYAGRLRLALAFSVAAVAVALALLWQARQGLTVLAAHFIDPNYALTALVVIVAIGLLRLAAVLHAYMAIDQARTRRRRDVGVLAALLAIIVGTHGLGAYAAFLDYSTFSDVFGGSDLPGVDQASPDPSDIASEATIAPAVTPAPGGRVTILLTGVDSYSGRSHRLNDSIMVVSIDRAAGKVAIVSVPRDSVGYPLYFDPKLTASVKINALATYVRNGWIKSPDDPTTTFIKEVGYLTGVQINYYAMIDLAGFVKLVDMVGGVDVVNPYLIDDPVYDWLDGSPHGFTLAAGPHHLNGRNALAYVRSRHGHYNNDYMRASRQQEVLVALEHKIASPSMIVRLPEFMQTAAKTIRTNYPAGDVADMVAFGEGIPKESISQVVLAPPDYMTNNCLRLDKIAPLSAKLFGSDSRYFGKAQPNVCG
jgi:LCP family protein required for cell wall assembly